jgi:phosphoglycerol transferase MdoB-like AlkP superfamily enzyme
MHIHVVELFLIIGLAGLAWWVNEMLDKVPVLNTVIKVLIVVVAILLVLQSLGLIGGGDASVSLR